MIEFTLSRVALGICGILLLASVIPFVENVHEDRVYEGSSYKAAMLCDIVSEGTYSCNSILRLTKIGQAVAVEALGFT